MKNVEVDKMVKIKQKENGVEMHFSKNVPQDVVRAQVDSCQAATCSCCTPAFKENVESFSTETTDNGIKVTIKGDITKEQVSENVLGCASKLKK